MGNVSDAVIQFLSSGKTRMAILSLLVLTTGVLTTIYLVGQQQDIRQRASGTDVEVCTKDGQGKCIYPYLGEGGTSTCTGSCRKPGDGAGGCPGVWVSANGVCAGAGESCQSCEYATAASDSQYYPGEDNVQIAQSQQSVPAIGTATLDCSACTSEKPYACPGLMGVTTTCSRISFFGICPKCEIPQATSTPAVNTPTPSVVDDDVCDYNDFDSSTKEFPLTSTCYTKQKCSTDIQMGTWCACHSNNNCASKNCATVEDFNNKQYCQPTDEEEEEISCGPEDRSDSGEFDNECHEILKCDSEGERGTWCLCDENAQCVSQKCSTADVNDKKFCEEGPAPTTKTPTVSPTPSVPTPTITPPVFCNSESYIYSCGTGNGIGNILRRPVTSPDTSVFWQCQQLSQQPYCVQNTSGCFTCGTPPLASPTPTANPECAGSTGKANGCVCKINVHCASGFCELTTTDEGICTNADEPTQTPGTLTCDPNADGVINLLDFQWWRDEFTGAKTTKVADCFSPNNTVDLQDFQVWREIFITGERQPF